MSTINVNTLRTAAGASPVLVSEIAKATDLAAPTGAGLVGANAYQTQDDVNKEIISVKRWGAVCNGVTDDTAAIQAAANALTNNQSLIIPAHTKILGTVTFTGKTNISVFGNGSTISVVGDSNPLKFLNCDQVRVFGLNFVGTVNQQQYEIAYTGTQVSTYFDSGTWVLQELLTTTATSANVTASKSGNVVSVALTADTGLTIDRGVRSALIPLTSGDKYVPVIDSGYMSGHACAATRFLKGGTSAYDPQGLDPVTYLYAPITGAASLAIKVGTGRAAETTPLSAISGYTGAKYDVSKISILKLVNESVTDITTGAAAFIEVAASPNTRIYNCSFQNHRNAVNVYSGSHNLVIANNIGKFIVQGFGVTTSARVSISNNTLDHRFLDNAGNLRPILFSRPRSVGGDLAGNSDFSITNNTFIGASWAVELVTKVGGVDAEVKNITVKNNVISGSRYGVSLNAVNGCDISNNTITATDAFAIGLVELAGASVNTDVTNNVMTATNPCGISCVGTGPGGSNTIFVGNHIKAAIPIARVGASVLTGITIKGNVLEYSSTSLFMRESACDISENTMTPFLDGYCDGIGYTPSSNTGLLLQFSATAVSTNVYKCFIRNNRMVGGLMNIARLDLAWVDFVGNHILQAYATQYGLRILPVFTSGSTNYNVSNNIVQLRTGYDPSINGFVNGTTALTGTCIAQDNVGGNGDCISFNAVSFSGAGIITVLGGIRGGGNFTWNPGTIANGATAVVTVAGLLNLEKLHYTVSPPYDMQGCQVFAYSYFSGSHILKLAISNTTGGSVSFASGSWNLRGTRRTS